MILAYGKQEATASLYLDGLPAAARARLHRLAPGSLARDAAALAAAEAVIVLREFRPLLRPGLLDGLRRRGTPLAWFCDDDLVALGQEEPAFAYYTARRVRGFARDCAACIASTPALVARLGAWHREVLLWPPILDDAQLPPAGPGHRAGAAGLRLGAFGGDFRAGSLAAHLGPVLAARPELTLCANAPLLAAAGLAGTAVPFEADFSAFLARWRALELDAVVHPYGATANIGNKSAASLLVASYLGAVPVVGDEPAYAGLGEAEGVLKVAPRPEAWAAALERLSDATTSAQLRARLRDWCRASFGPQPALRALDHLASLPAPRRRWRQWLWGRLAP